MLIVRINLSCDLCDPCSLCTVGLRSTATPGAIGDPLCKKSSFVTHDSVNCGSPLLSPGSIGPVCCDRIEDYPRDPACEYA